MRIVRELQSLVRLLRTPAKDKAIVIYSEQESYFAYFEDIAEELTRVAGVTISYITSDPDDAILGGERQGVRAFYLHRLLPYYMVLCRPRVFVATLMDLGESHLRRSVHPVHYLHVFHGLNSTHMTCRETAFDHYDALLCAGPHHVEEIRARERRAGLAPKELIEGGYPRLDRIRRAVRAGAPPAPRPVVLVAPSWYEGNIWDTCGWELVDAILAADLSAVLRMHPETVKRAPRQVEELEARYGEDPRVTIERSVLGDESLVRADVLVTDWSCIALEFAFGTERPVLYIDLPRKIRNERWRELGIEPVEATLREEVGIVVPPSEIEGIAAVVENLIRNRASWRKRIVAKRDEYVFALDRSGKIAARHILERSGLNGHGSSLGADADRPERE